jgi:transposase
MKPGRAGTMTHDYKRNGTTTLFAALNVLDGTVISRNMKRHRHQEFIRFLNDIDAQAPRRKAIHAIVDNYATHKHPKVRKWLAQHPRWTFHFTPTSASWLNAIEGFFAKLTNRRLKRGVFRSVQDLQAAIDRFVAETNADPKPFVWTDTPKPHNCRCQTREGKVRVGPLARSPDERAARHPGAGETPCPPASRASCGRRVRHGEAGPTEPPARCARWRRASPRRAAMAGWARSSPPGGRRAALATPAGSPGR